MTVIGTAGHVDHGKSTLVLALTGRDPDRWREEKERGLTIDLGFAWMTLPDGTELSFVDVPGHERFIKNMLAGTESIDGAILVVAADEGWMPQSEEHAVVLDLLGIDVGVVAVTKIDRVDADLVDLAALEAEERLAGTGLARAPLVRVSATTGEGLPELIAHLAEMAARIEEGRSRVDRPRLWVDRVFSVSGAGTVVTGTLVDGSLAVGDDVMTWPAGSVGRIRGLHSHERPHDTVAPGSRCAVNLVGIDPDHLARGSMLGRPHQWATSSTWLATVTRARYVDAPIASRGAYQVHVGSGAWQAEVRPLTADAIEGTGSALVRIERALPVAVGDRFILRETGRRAVVGGGRIVDPLADRRPSRARATLDLLEGIVDMTPEYQADRLLAAHRSARLVDLESWTRGGRPTRGLFAGELVLAPDHASGLAEQAVDHVTAYHRTHPLRPGMPAASLAERLGVDLVIVRLLCRNDDRLRDDGATVAAGGFRAGLSAEEETEWIEVRDRLAEAGLTVPRLSELGLSDEVLHVLFREGRLVRLSDDLAYLPSQLDEIRELVHGLAAPFSVAELRDGLGVTRRYAVPIVEWLDASGFTRRDGDLRTVR